MATASNFRITIHNSTNDEVKATRFEYKDGSKWRTEAMFGLDGHQKIEKGHGIVFTRDQGVGGKDTQFRVTYQHAAVRPFRAVDLLAPYCGATGVNGASPYSALRCPGSTKNRRITTLLYKSVMRLE